MLTPQIPDGWEEVDSSDENSAMHLDDASSSSDSEPSLRGLVVSSEDYRSDSGSIVRGSNVSSEDRVRLKGSGSRVVSDEDIENSRQARQR